MQAALGVALLVGLGERPGMHVPCAHARGVLSVSCAILGGQPLVCSSGYDNTIKLWQLNGDDELQLLHVLEDAEKSAVFSTALARQEGSDGLLLCAGNYARRVRVWDIETSLQIPPNLMWTSDQHTGWVRSLAVGSRQRGSASASRLYSIGCNRILGWSLDKEGAAMPPEDAFRRCCCELALYEEDDPESEELYRSHDILTLAHTDEAELLASGSVDGALRVWSTSELRTLDTLPRRVPAKWLGHPEGTRVADVAWARDRDGTPRLLLSCGYDGRVRCWQSPTGGDAAAATTAEGAQQLVEDSALSGGGAGDAWTLLAEACVVASGGEAGGRALSLAVGHGAASGLAVCATSEGALVALSTADLSIVSRLVLPREGGGVGGGGGGGGRGGGGGGGGGGGSMRATAVAAVPPTLSVNGETRDALRSVFVAGDSEGGLHVCSAGADGFITSDEAA